MSQPRVPKLNPKGLILWCSKWPTFWCSKWSPNHAISGHHHVFLLGTWSRFALVKVLVGGKNHPNPRWLGAWLHLSCISCCQESPGRKYARQASDCADFSSWNQWILVRGSFSVTQHLPFGKHTKNDGKIYHFIAGKIHYFDCDWAMASIANCLFTRGYTVLTPGQVPPPILWEEGWTGWTPVGDDDGPGYLWTNQ